VERCYFAVWPQDVVADLVERWSRSDPNAETEVNAILKSHGFENADLDAEALARSSSELAAMDQLLTSACSRRDKNLAGFVFAGEISTRQTQDLIGRAAERGLVRLAQPKKKA
jgi:hypothetical protein